MHQRSKLATACRALCTGMTQIISSRHTIDPRNSLFYGKSQQVLSIPDTPDRVQDETFSYLLVNVVEGGQSIYEGLDSSFQETEIDVEGKTGSRQVHLVEPPQVLQIQLQVRNNNCS